MRTRRRFSLALGVLVGAMLLTIPAAPATASTYCGSLEGFEVRAKSSKTGCGFAMATARKLRRVAFSGGLEPRFSMTVRGRDLACRSFYVGKAQTIVCRGYQRVVKLQYTFP